MMNGKSPTANLRVDLFKKNMNKKKPIIPKCSGLMPIKIAVARKNIVEINNTMRLSRFDGSDIWSFI